MQGAKLLNNPLLSVIIPCYNCAPVIVRCIDSIDYPDAEIIVVNDGSTDNVTEVIEKYSAAHSNVRLINKQNGGVSSARNMGIREARGKYICFVDADDYLMEGGLANLVKLAEETKSEVVKYKIHHVKNDAPYNRIKLYDYDIHTEMIGGKSQALLRYDISDYHVVDALFLRDTIIKNSVYFIEDIFLHEDDVFMGMLYCHTSKVVVTDLPLYCYIRSSTYSSTHNVSPERELDLIKSALRAVEERQNYIMGHFPEALNLERLKYMRWVCQPKTAFLAGLSLLEYEYILKQFGNYGIYPLDYKWINIAHWYASPKTKLKLAIKTFLTNHPQIAYMLLSH